MKLPPDAPLRDRLRHTFYRFMTHHNRLDGIMASVAIWWAAWTIIFPDFWRDWPVTAVLNHRTGGHPWMVSWVLLISGIGSYWSRSRQKKRSPHPRLWHFVRTFSALLAFGSWGTLALIFMTVTPIYSPGAAVYSWLAIAKLFSYTNYVLRIDAEDSHVKFT